MGRLPTLLSLGLAVLMGGLTATPSYAKKSALTPAKVKAAKREQKSYDTCRKGAVAQLKRGGAVGKKKFEAALTSCQENFPGASLYIACKQTAVHTARTKGMPEKDAVEQCKRYLIATAFDPKGRFPFFAEAGQLFFTGIGLNRPQPTASLAPPNFACDRVEEVAKDPKSADFLLFGNHPRTFAALAEIKGDPLLRLLRLPKPSKSGVTTSTFGRVFDDPRTTKGVAFFPSAPCDFEAETGDIYAGLSAYYLMDQSSASVTPYFGIAYYLEDQATVTTARLVQETAALLGPEYKSISKNKLVTFVAAAPLAERDDEQDPKNLCRKPRPHQFVAIIQAHKDRPTRPEYLLIANVKNLCDFGDRLSKRLTE